MNPAPVPPRAVFLDRDGTIIEDRHYLADPAGVALLPGAGEALDQGDAGRCDARVGVGHRLHRHGMRAADRAGADADFVRRAAPVLRKIDHLFPVL